MSDKIPELLSRNLQEVFGEGDAARRRAVIEELYTEDCVLYVPVGVFVGRDALDKFAEDLRATHPHFAYTPLREPRALHNAAAWPGGPARAANGQTIPAWTSSSSAATRSLGSVCSSIQCRHDTTKSSCRARPA
jgi:hypothetical protein